MKVLDLCSGIGGFSLAARWMGWQTVAFCEIDAWCRGKLAKNFPGVPIFEDIRDVTAESISARRIERPDIVVGGIPCQPYSVAGKQQGEADDRALWGEAFRIIEDLKPRWIVIENVSGFIGMALDGCISDLEGEGYEARAFVLPACAVNAPHRRDRVWLVAHAGSPERRKHVNHWHDAGRQETASGFELLRQERVAADSASRGLRRRRTRGQGGQSAFTGESAAASHASSNGSATRISGQEPREEGDAGILDDGCFEGAAQFLVADSYSPRLAQREAVRRSGGSALVAHEGEDASCRIDGDASFQLSHRSGSSGQSQRRESTDTDRRQTLRGLRDLDDGISERLAGLDDLPDWYGGGWTMPAPTNDGEKERVNKLKALGNAVVPELVFEIFKAIQEVNSR